MQDILHHGVRKKNILIRIFLSVLNTERNNLKKESFFFFFGSQFQRFQSKAGHDFGPEEMEYHSSGQRLPTS
jgi:hypothetical protein